MGRDAFNIAFKMPPGKCESEGDTLTHEFTTAKIRKP